MFTFILSLKLKVKYAEKNQIITCDLTDCSGNKHPLTIPGKYDRLADLSPPMWDIIFLTEYPNGSPGQCQETHTSQPNDQEHLWQKTLSKAQQTQGLSSCVFWVFQFNHQLKVQLCYFWFGRFDKLCLCRFGLVILICRFWFGRFGKAVN